MKKNKLVYLAFYRGTCVCVASTAAKRNICVKRLIVESDYKVDKFYFEEYPLL